MKYPFALFTTFFLFRSITQRSGSALSLILRYHGSKRYLIPIYVTYRECAFKLAFLRSFSFSGSIII